MTAAAQVPPVGIHYYHYVSKRIATIHTTTSLSSTLTMVSNQESPTLACTISKMPTDIASCQCMYDNLAVCT